MKAYFAVFLLSIWLVAGCAPVQESDAEQEQLEDQTFNSEDFGFSFTFPGNWEEVTKDLPNNWAILNSGDTILFTTSDAATNDLAVLGARQLLIDSGENAGGEVQIASFNNREWYTYGIEFTEESINSIVSGTVCDPKEVSMVLVTKKETYETNREVYRSILDSFSC